MFRRRPRPHQSHPHDAKPCDGEFRLDHFVNIFTGGVITLINAREGIIGMVEGWDYTDSKRQAEEIMALWDIEKVARAGND